MSHQLEVLIPLSIFHPIKNIEMIRKLYYIDLYVMIHRKNFRVYPKSNTPNYIDYIYVKISQYRNILYFKHCMQ